MTPKIINWEMLELFFNFKMLLRKLLRSDLTDIWISHCWLKDHSPGKIGSRTLQQFPQAFKSQVSLSKSPHSKLVSRLPLTSEMIHEDLILLFSININ